MDRPQNPTEQLPERVRDLAATVAAEARARFGSEVRTLWFGSWVTGRARPHSDIDLALSAPAPLPARNLAALRDWIDDLPTLYSIDLLDLNRVGDPLRHRIRDEAIEL